MNLHQYEQPTPSGKPSPDERLLADFIAAQNFGRRLKAPKGLTPHEFI